MNGYMKSGVYTRNGSSYNFNYNTNISTSQKVSFVNNVVDVVVGDNYYDFLFNLMFGFEIIDKFTDIDLSSVSESFDQIGAIESFIGETDALDIVVADMDSGLFEQLRNSVKMCIEYKTGVHISDIESAIASLIRDIDEKIVSFDASSMVDAVKRLNEIPGELTADKMMAAYMKTDAYKSQHANKGENKPSQKKPRKKSTKPTPEGMKIIDGGKQEAAIDTTASDKD